ncbi:hypothetical protein GCM10023083_41230 [Streptomyces phyllanthi]
MQQDDGMTSLNEAWDELRGQLRLGQWLAGTVDWVHRPGVTGIGVDLGLSVTGRAPWPHDRVIRCPSATPAGDGLSVLLLTVPVHQTQPRPGDARRQGGDS